MNEVQRPTISVVIPALNEELYLARALESLAQQSYRDFEVIVADNGSTDATAAIARAHGARVVMATKPGVCAARQAGTAAARGRIVVSTDADTIFDPGWLAQIARAFRDPAVVLVTGPPRFEDAPIWGRLYTRLLFGSIELWHRLTGRLWYVSACNLAFRKSAWQGYNTDLTQGGDELALLRQLRHQGDSVYLPDNLVWTSSRRMKRGFLYNVVVTCLAYYVGDYILSRFTNKSLLGSYPQIRDQRSQRPDLGWRLASFTLVAAAAFSLVYTKVPMAHALGKDIHRPHLHRLDIDWRLRHQEP